MLKFIPFVAVTAALTFTAGVSPNPRPDDGPTDMCYGCCSNNEIWLPCCLDPSFEYHALPCFAWGSGMLGPYHDNCVWGGCSQHSSCGGEEEVLDEVAGRIESGDIAILAEIRNGAFRSVMMNEARQAVQIYSSCGTLLPRLVGHLPLRAPYFARTE